MRWSDTKATGLGANSLTKLSYLGQVRGKECVGGLPAVSVLASVRRTDVICIRETKTKASALYARPGACCVVDCLDQKLLAGTCGFWCC